VEWSAAHLATLAQASYVRTNPELNIAVSKGTKLGVAQPRLSCDEEQHAVSPSDPCVRVRRGDEGCGLLFGEEID
jgi:hypothetical protein